MKVCFVSHSSGRGGSERSLLETIDVLQGRGVASLVVLPATGFLSEALAARDVRYRVLASKWWMRDRHAPAWRGAGRLVWNLGCAATLARELAGWGSSVVWSNSLTVCVGAFAAALVRQPHVWSVRELGLEHHGLAFDLGPRLSLGLVHRLSRLCVANSRVVAEHFATHIPAAKLRIIHPWVREPAAGGSPLARSRRLRFVCVGALTPGKRQDEAIRALAELTRGGLDAELALVGSGDPRWGAQLADLSASLGLSERVHFLGELDDPFPELGRADVLVVCSRGEAFGRVTVEGMLAGLPVVGARDGGTAELIEHGQNGWLYEPGDVHGLAERLRQVSEEPGQARAIGQRAQVWARARFSEERYAREVLAALGEAAGQPGSAASRSDRRP